jgi:FKBP-type peptidyl-prolyl cis-trans isomerase
MFCGVLVFRRGRRASLDWTAEGGCPDRTFFENLDSTDLSEFAEIHSRCDNVYMHKFFAVAINLLAAGLLLGNALAQETPAATPPTSSTPAASAPKAAPTSSPAKAQTPATKTHSAVAAKAAAPLALKTQKEKFSYALGMSNGKRLGESLRKQTVPFDAAILARGMKDGLAGGKTLLTDQEAQAAMDEVRSDLLKKQQAAGKKEGDDFLAANKGKEGVVTLPSGLQYKILKAGTGPKPTASDAVLCNYRGTLVNGTEFDSSYKRGQPLKFPVGGVIKGWTEALQLMPVGSKWQLFIPSDLAYGESGQQGIPPNSTLIFEVELVSIEEQKKEEQKK